MTAPEQRRCALYRHYDARDVLLYVGITEGLIDRTNGHARSSEWVRFAARAEAEWYDSREAASKAEQQAVRDEEPIYNRQYAEWDVDRRIADYLKDREVRSLTDRLKAYAAAVDGFLSVAPADDVKEANARTEHDYNCAEQPKDNMFPAHVLRHLGGMYRERAEEIRDDASIEAYTDVLSLIKERLEAIQERRRRSWEAPF